MKATGLKYTILLERHEEGGYSVTVPSLLGCITQGATWDEAITHGREAIAGYLEVLRDLGKPIPVEVAGEVAAEAVTGTHVES